MRTRALRILSAATCVASIAVAGGAGAADPAKAPCGSGFAVVGARWAQSTVPFPSGPSQASMVSAVAFQPDELFAGNGSVVMRSADAGCTWRALTPPTPELAGLVEAPSTITAIATPSSATSNGFLYVGGSAGVSVAQTPYLAVSHDSGNTWLGSPSGLPTLGTVTQVAAADDDPSVAYAFIAGPPGQPDELDATEDGGLTWSKRATFSSSAPMTSLRVNPVVATQLFLLGPTGMLVSSDGGRTWAPVSRTSGDVQSFDLAVGSGSMEIVQGRQSARQFTYSRDGGLSWQVQPSLLPAQQVAVAPVTNAVIAGNSQGLFLWWPLGGRYVPFPFQPPSGVPTALQMTAPTKVGFGVVGLLDGRVVRAVWSLVTRSLVASETPVVLLPPGPAAKQFPSTLLPLSTALRLPAGGHADVNYQLLLPRTPAPVDVMFLVDTTSSQSPTIDGLRQGLAGIVNQLGTLGFDVEFGLADFRDYPSTLPEGGGDETDYPYKLRRQIGTDIQALTRAIGNLKTSGGGDPPEADLTALYQSTTGAGQVIDHQVVIPRGQIAGYRRDSLRLAVVATDAPFHREKDYYTPTWKATVAALRAAGVHQIGLAVQGYDTAYNPPRSLGYPSRPDEAQMAVATGAVAPTGGIDCNGDGQPDVPAGHGMVCDVAIPQPSGVQTLPGVSTVVKPPPVTAVLGNALVSLVSTLRDPAPVGLRVTGGPATLAQVVSSPAAPVVNLRADNTLSYAMRYTCPLVHAAKTYHLAVTATAGANSLVASSTELACGALGAKPGPSVAAALPPAAAPAAAAVNGTPPNPPVNTNGNPNPNPAVNPNAGFASQDQEQPQLAFAGADQGLAEEDGTQLAMSRRRTDEDTAPWSLGAAGLLAMAAAGYAVRTRRRTQTCQQHTGF